jgi:hypothetical protein
MSHEVLSVFAVLGFILLLVELAAVAVILLHRKFGLIGLCYLGLAAGIISTIACLWVATR